MAEIPEADPPYHDDLEVVHFVFLHRHGIRSPVKKCVARVFYNITR